MGRPAIDITGQVFGRWTVSARDGKMGADAAFICVCACGNVKRVRGERLRSGKSQSCGCAGREKLGNMARKHGLHKHHLYSTWRAMRERCNSPNHQAYHLYGGRGISVCRRWGDFAAFLEDMLPSWRSGLTLDRIDNSGNYEPGNCRWATYAEQGANRRQTGRYLTHAGKIQTVTEWARELGLTPSLISQRLHRGADTKDALRRRYKRRTSGG